MSHKTITPLSLNGSLNNALGDKKISELIVFACPVELPS
jgi:hypothetical protein